MGNRRVHRSSLCFGIATFALAGALAWRGAFALDAIGPSLLALLPTALGMLIGIRLRSRISSTLFRRAFFLTLLVLGGHILWQALRWLHCALGYAPLFGSGE